MKRGIGSPGGFGNGDASEPPSKRASGHGGHGRNSEAFGSNIPRTRHAFKVLMTDGLAAGLLGSHGSVKDDIQKETGCRLVFSNRNDYFPDTKYRVMGIYADDPHVILDVFNCIIPQLIFHGDEERKSQPSGQTDLCGKELGEYIFRFALTRRMQSQIVGSQGCNIKFIRQDSGAKVFVENESVLGHRAGKVIGTPQTILAALRHINEFVQCESEFEEEFYQGYSRLVNFTEAQQRGWEPPPEPKDGDKPGGNKRVASGAGITTSGVVGGKGGGKNSRNERVVPPKAGYKTGGAGYTPAPDVLKNIVPPPPAVTLQTTAHNPPAVAVAAESRATSSSAGRPSKVSVTEEVDHLADALRTFPSGTVKLQYSLCCEVPASSVGLLVGTGGELIRQTEQASGAKIEIERSKGESRTMTLVGTLQNIYVAHAMMMSRLQSLNREAQDEEKEEDEEREEEEMPEVPEVPEAQDEVEEIPQEEEPAEAERDEHHEGQEENLHEGSLEESDEDLEPEEIRQMIAKLEEKLARALARRNGE